MKKLIPIVAVVFGAALTFQLFSADAQSQSAWLTPQEVRARQQDQSALVVDVRTPSEFRAGHVSGAVNFPLDEIEAMTQELTRESAGRPIVLYCRSGRRAHIAEDILRHHGFQAIYHLQGQLAGWAAEGLPVDR